MNADLRYVPVCGPVRIAAGALIVSNRDVRQIDMSAVDERPAASERDTGRRDIVVLVGALERARLAGTGSGVRLLAIRTARRARVLGGGGRRRSTAQDGVGRACEAEIDLIALYPGRHWERILAV